ncbi:hypothetical protein E1H12_17130 [Geitlerinema sp. P-1104]|nr:hypothetical protein [Geitlerinema sp. P-1104]
MPFPPGRGRGGRQQGEEGSRGKKAAGSRQQAVGGRKPFFYCLLPIAYCLLPIAYCLFPYSLPTGSDAAINTSPFSIRAAASNSTSSK